MKSRTLVLTLVILSTVSTGWTKEMTVDLKALWNMDEIRKVPFDVEVISSREDKGYRIDEMYFTTEMTPNGPNRMFCAFARPIKPAKLVPVLLMVHEGLRAVQRRGDGRFAGGWPSPWTTTLAA